jgi:hypothetical protein
MGALFLVESKAWPQFLEIKVYKYAYGKPANQEASQENRGAHQGSGPGKLPAKTRRMHARLHHDSKETELGIA